VWRTLSNVKFAVLQISILAVAGVIGTITPWNYPLNQIACKVAPALACGCTMVLKPSEIAPFSGHVLAEILHEAGVPAGVFNLVDGDGPTVGAAISSHPGIDMVSFTGSTRAGIMVDKAAADTVKKVSMELGGNAPFIVFDDADVDAAVAAAGKAFGKWGKSSPGERQRVLLEIAARIERRANEFALLETRNVGKPIRESRTIDIPAAIDHFRYFAGVLRHIQGHTQSVGTSMLHFTLREPLGPVAAIVPWNYPLLLAAWKLAPALAAGRLPDAAARERFTTTLRTGYSRFESLVRQFYDARFLDNVVRARRRRQERQRRPALDVEGRQRRRIAPGEASRGSDEQSDCPEEGEREDLDPVRGEDLVLQLLAAGQQDERRPLHSAQERAVVAHELVVPAVARGV